MFNFTFVNYIFYIIILHFLLKAVRKIDLWDQ